MSIGLHRILILGFALPTGCGIDLGNRHDDLSEEEIEGRSKAAHKECGDSLKEIAKLVNKYSTNYNIKFKPTGFLPDETPSQAKRKWGDGGAFDTIGWKPKGRIQGSYKLEATGSSSFRATCITDVDEDGSYATWTVTESSDPARTSGEGVR
jgi:hypothetical protein